MLFLWLLRCTETLTTAVSIGRCNVYGTQRYSTSRLKFWYAFTVLVHYRLFDACLLRLGHESGSIFSGADACDQRISDARGIGKLTARKLALF